MKTSGSILFWDFLKKVFVNLLLKRVEEREKEIEGETSICERHIDLSVALSPTGDLADNPGPDQEPN